MINHTTGIRERGRVTKSATQALLLLLVILCHFVYIEEAEAGRGTNLSNRYVLSGVATLEYDAFRFPAVGSATPSGSAFNQSYSLGLTGPIIDSRLAYFGINTTYTSHTTNSGAFNGDAEPSYSMSELGVHLILFNNLSGLKNPKYRFLLYLPRPILINYSRNARDGSMKFIVTRYGLSTSYYLPFYMQFFSGGKIISLVSPAEVAARLRQLRQLEAREKDEDDDDEGGNAGSNADKTNSGNSGNAEGNGNGGNGRNSDNENSAAGRKKQKRGRENSGAEAVGKTFIPFPSLYFDVDRLLYTDGANTFDSISLDLRARILSPGYRYGLGYSFSSSSDVSGKGGRSLDRTLTFDSENYIRSFKLTNYLSYDVRDEVSYLNANSNAYRLVELSQNSSYSMMLDGTYNSNSNETQDTYRVAATSAYTTRYVPKSIPAVESLSTIGATVNFAKTSEISSNTANLGTSLERSQSDAFNNARNSNYSMFLGESVSYRGLKGFNISAQANMNISEIGVPFGARFQVATESWRGLALIGAYSFERGNDGRTVQGVDLGTSGALRLNPYVTLNAQLKHTEATAFDGRSSSNRADLGLNGAYDIHRISLRAYASRSKGPEENAVVTDTRGIGLLYTARIRRDTNISVQWSYDDSPTAGSVSTDFLARLNWFYGRVSVDVEYELRKIKEQADFPVAVTQRLFLRVSRSFRKLL